MKKKERIDFYIALIVISLFGVFIGYYSFADFNNIETPLDHTTGEDFSIVRDQDLKETIELDGATYRSKSIEYNKLSDQRIIDEEIDTNDSLFTYHTPLPYIKEQIVEPTNRVVINLDSLHEGSHEQGGVLQETIEKAAADFVEKEEADTDIPIEKTVERVNAVIVEDVTNEVKTVQKDIKDCIIIIGAFSKQANINKLLNRLNKSGYDSFTTPFRGLTRVGIRLSCDKNLSKSILSEVRARYAKDAVLMERE